MGNGSLTVLLTATLLGSAAGAEEKPAGLVVEAWVSTAGPYGESWDLKLTPGGEIALQVFYSINPSGSLMARFSLSDERVAGIRKAIESERFFELPVEIAPPTAPLHQPDLRLDVWVSGGHHKVALYDPDQLPSDPNARRFLTVWKRLYEGLPIKPSWSGSRDKPLEPPRPHDE
jgi:hypothetical protein